MFRYILFCLLFFLTNFSFSQQAEVTNTIYLSDGSVLVGTLLENENDNEKILKLKDGTILHLLKTSIVQIDPAKAKRYNVSDHQNKFGNSGLYNLNYVGVNGGIRESQSSSIGFHISSSVGYMLNKYIGIGIGVGVDKFDFEALNNAIPFYNNNISEVSPITCIYPVFLEARGKLFGENTAYYYSMNVGYGFVNKNEDLQVRQAHGGVMFHPAIGICFGGKKHFNLCIDMGIKYQKTDFVLPIFFDSGEDHFYINYKRFILRVGMQI